MGNSRIATAVICSMGSQYNMGMHWDREKPFTHHAPRAFQLSHVISCVALNFHFLSLVAPQLGHL